MTGYRSTFFRHKCAGAGCYIDGLPCWDDLIETFPRGIRPTDVDGFVEINGRFLFLEEKRAGVPFGNNPGQFRALKLLAGLPGVTVLFFRPGATADYEYLLLDKLPGLANAEVRECSRGQMHAWLRRWARTADEVGAA